MNIKIHAWQELRDQTHLVSLVEDVVQVEEAMMDEVVHHVTLAPHRRLLACWRRRDELGGEVTTGRLLHTPVDDTECAAAKLFEYVVVIVDWAEPVVGRRWPATASPRVIDAAVVVGGRVTVKATATFAVLVFKPLLAAASQLGLEGGEDGGGLAGKRAALGVLGGDPELVLVLRGEELVGEVESTCPRDSLPFGTCAAIYN